MDKYAASEHVILLKWLIYSALLKPNIIQVMLVFIAFDLTLRMF